jgi:hypothetical protein
MKETYKNLIMELLDALDAKALQSIYSFIRGMMAGKGGAA